MNTRSLLRFAGAHFMRVAALALMLAVLPRGFAQGITTSAINGFVTDKQGKPVAGATISVLHEPSGTRASAVTRPNGQYNLSGLRVGGPYTVSVSAKDFVTEPRSEVYLGLDQAQEVSFNLSSEVVKLEAFSVNDSRDTTFGGGRISSGSNYGSSDIANAATVRRNVQDIARLDSRLTLNSLDQGGQLSAQGQNFRFNSFLIDGVQANDTFGLNGNGFSSLRSPIPLDAVQSLSVDISPYDLRRAGFTGALINAVTKSGSNEFHGTASYEYSDQDMRAKNPITGTKDIFKERSFNFGIGGPIIRNKLFFYLNYDDFKRDASPPTGNFVPDSTQLAAIVARAKALGYDAGSLDAVNTAKQKTTIAKIDWNISDAHRLAFTYRKNDGTEPIFPGFTGTTTTTLSNYWYQQPRVTESYTAQLFSTWTPDFRTEATVAYTEYDGTPKNNGAAFPAVTIGGITGIRRDTGATATGSVILGTEASRQFNFLTTKNTSGTIVGEYSLGDHTLTFGGESDETKYTNLFVQNINGAYTFNNITGGTTGLANWQAGTLPTTYVDAQAFAGRSISESYALWKYTAYAAFIQDSWKPNNQLTVTAGLRLDYPYIPAKPPYNAAFESAFGIRNDTTNSGNYTIAPRAGFNYALKTDRKTQFRGGIGLFQGKNPAVWISNAYSNAGAIGNVTLNAPTGTGLPIVFEPNPAKQPVPVGVPPAPNINVTAKDFVQPSVWKGNLAFDHTLPFLGLVASVEYNASRTYKGVNTTYLNYQEATTGSTIMPDGRIRYNGTITPGGTINGVTQAGTTLTGRRRVATFADVFLLKNTDKGISNFATLSLNRPMKDNWAAGVSWTHGKATEVSPATSSTASSNYNLRAAFNPNEDVAATSNTSTRDKIVGVFTRQFEFVKNYPTTFSFIYEGHTGRPYSWVFRGDANGDGFTSNDLFYVPTGPTDSKVRFADPAEQAAFYAYVANTPGLSKYAGRVVPRNGDAMPWVNTIDLKITQNIPIYKSVKTELYLNVINLANLVDKKWGILDEVDFPYRRAVAGTTYDAAANGGAGQYVYRFVPSSTLDSLSTVANDTSASRWQILMGVRVKF